MCSGYGRRFGAARHDRCRMAISFEAAGRSGITAPPAAAGSDVWAVAASAFAVPAACEAPALAVPGRVIMRLASPGLETIARSSPLPPSGTENRCDLFRGHDLAIRRRGADLERMIARRKRFVEHGGEITGAVDSLRGNDVAAIEDLDLGHPERRCRQSRSNRRARRGECRSARATSVGASAIGAGATGLPSKASLMAAIMLAALAGSEGRSCTMASARAASA
jgi:hypothetical protein